MICDFGWQSLEARKAVSRLSLMYKIAHGLVDLESQVLVRNGRATRQSQGQHYFRNILALKSCYRAPFFPRTVPEWNHLPLTFGTLLLLTALRLLSTKSITPFAVHLEKIRNHLHLKSDNKVIIKSEKNVKNTLLFV